MQSVIICTSLTSNVASHQAAELKQYIGKIVFIENWNLHSATAHHSRSGEVALL